MGVRSNLILRGVRREFITHRTWVWTNLSHSTRCSSSHLLRRETNLHMILNMKDNVMNAPLFLISPSPRKIQKCSQAEDVHNRTQLSWTRMLTRVWNEWKWQDSWAKTPLLCSNEDIMIFLTIQWWVPSRISQTKRRSNPSSLFRRLRHSELLVTSIYPWLRFELFWKQMTMVIPIRSYSWRVRLVMLLTNWLLMEREIISSHLSQSQNGIISQGIGYLLMYSSMICN